MDHSAKHTHRKQRPGLLLVVSAWTMAAALSAGLVNVAFSAGLFGSPESGTLPLAPFFATQQDGLVHLFAGFLASCVETGVVEEVLFRGVFLFLFVKGASLPRFGLSYDKALLAAVVASSVAFGLAHLAGSPLACLTPPELLALALKVVQASLFGFCMASLVATRRSLIAPILIHIAFDALYFAPGYFASGSFPVAYSLAGPVDAVVLVATILLFLPPVRACTKALRGTW